MFAKTAEEFADGVLSDFLFFEELAGYRNEWTDEIIEEQRRSLIDHYNKNAIRVEKTGTITVTITDVASEPTG